MQTTRGKSYLKPEDASGAAVEPFKTKIPMSADDDNNAGSEEGGGVVGGLQQPAEQAKQNKPSARHRKDADDGGKPGGTVVVVEPRGETVRLVGEPLASHGPYAFYAAFRYRHRDNAARQKKRHRWKTPCSGETCCGDDSCSCSDDGGGGGGGGCEWSVVRMNHFYAVCPWYSKRNSCAGDQGQLCRGRKKSPAARAAGKERRQNQHQQQSVCIGELELLWRDDSVVTVAAKRACGDKSCSGAAANGGGSAVTTGSSSNSLQAPSSDEEAAAAAAGETAPDAAASLPRRRMLPRRRRQPSAKKLEAAESYAAAASDRSHPLHASYRRNQSACPARAPSYPSAADAHYAHGNLLCSVRLYVMPDQTAAGRLSGVHGEDEVLEINSCPAEFINGGGGGGMGSVHHAAAGDDYGYGCSSGAPQSRCSGLVLRVEDFVEWVRGGQMMNEEEVTDTTTGDEATDSGGDTKSSAAESEKPKPSAKTDETRTEVVVPSSEVVAVKEERSASNEDAVEVKKERKSDSTEAEDGAPRPKSVVDEAVNAERVPLAAADILKNRDGVRRRRQHRVDCSKSSVNGSGGAVTAKHESSTEKQKVDTGRDEQRRCGREKTSNKQQLVVMSYSRYCRYRAQLQRSREERFNRGEDSDNSTTTDQMNTIRVLFCRDTYDYPAELLLQPFNPPHGYQHNSAVLANHMAPKLKGWPAYPASWMSFRWNRVHRRLRHMERGNGSNDEQQRRRRRRKKLKKKGRPRQNGASGTTVALGYLSSTDDRDSDDSDSDRSSATNDGATNTTTSDSDGAPPNASVVAKTAIKNLASKENGKDHHKNRPVISVSAASNIIFINGTSVSTVNANKRPAAIAGQSVQQQSSKRRCIVYTSTTTGQRPQIRAVYQQQQQPRPRQPQQLYQQFNQLSQSQRHHFLVAQQHQQRLQLNRRLPTPVSSLQPNTTRLTHHHLPPSVSILPVIVPGNKNVTIFQQQQQRLNDRLQSRPKQLAAVSVTQSQNSNSNRPQTSLSPIIVEYDKSQKQRSDKNNTLATAMATCHKRIRCIDLEQEQPEDEERQRRWLVDALRLGGLEVTAVPVKNNSGSHNKSGSENNKVIDPVATLQQQPHLKREKQSSDHEPNGNVSVQYEKRKDCSNDDSNQDSDTDSVIMTVTPDVISLLNKSRQQQQSKSQTSSVSSSTSLSTPAQKQQLPTVVKDTASSCDQRASGVVTAPALHDKINRAIDSLKQQQQQKQPMNKSHNVFMMDGSSPRLYNKVISYTVGELGQRKLGVAGTNQIRQQLQTLKPVKQISSAVKIKINPQQKQQTQKRESVSLPTQATNLEISLVPTTLAVAYVTKVQSQQQQKSCTSAVVRNISVSSSETSSSMSVKQQLQRRITAGSLKPPALTPIMGALSSGSVQPHTQQQRNNISTFVTTTAPLLQPTQQQIIILASPAGSTSVAKQPLNDKVYPQQKKKD